MRRQKPVLKKVICTAHLPNGEDKKMIFKGAAAHIQSYSVFNNPRLLMIEKLRHQSQEDNTQC